MSIKANLQGTGASYGHSHAICGELADHATATGSTQATAKLLERKTRHIVTAGTGGVIVPPGVGLGDALQEGDEIEITNATNADILVYPPTGTAFLGYSINTGITLSPNFSLSVLVDSATRFIARYYQSTPGSIGTGTVVSVGLALPSSILSVSGSPVTTSGTLIGDLQTQAANFVWAGPTTGVPAQPTFRGLVLADIPDLTSLYAPLTSGTSILYGNGSGGFSNATIGSGLSFVGGTLTATGSGGTVTSVGLSAPNIFSVSGSPVTTTGTLAFSVANQNANLVWSGPSSGGAATPTFRSLVAADLPTNIRTVDIALVIDGGGSAITTGIKGDLVVDFDCTITAATLLADQTGSIVIDIWKDTYANYPPTVADTITASAKPTLSSAVKANDTTLTGWTTSITAGQTLRYNVDSATTVTRVVLALKVLKT